MESEPARNQIEALQEQLERWDFRPSGNDPEFGPKSAEDVAAVEAELGRRLPEDYRWFCLTYGSGYIPGQAYIHVEADEDDPVEVERDVIDFDRLGWQSTLQKSRTVYFAPGPYCADALVPCASTIWGDQFFLRLDEPHNGSVWVWDQFYERDARHGLLRAADTFTDLLASSLHIIAQTERLTLRQFEREDSTALLEIHRSEETMRLMPRGLLTDEAAATTLIEERRAQQQATSYSTWAVVLTSTDQLIGSCGFRGSEPDGPFELGYVIDHNHWGHGYATEAANAAIEHIFGLHTAHRKDATVFATIRPNNEPSIAVARRLNMRQVESIADEYGELLKFELNKE